MREWLFRGLMTLALIAVATVAGFLLTGWLVTPPPGIDGYVPAFLGGMASGSGAAIALGLRAVLTR